MRNAQRWQRRNRTGTGGHVTGWQQAWFMTRLHEGTDSRGFVGQSREGRQDALTPLPAAREEMKMNGPRHRRKEIWLNMSDKIFRIELGFQRKTNCCFVRFQNVNQENLSIRGKNNWDREDTFAIQTPKKRKQQKGRRELQIPAVTHQRVTCAWRCLEAPVYPCYLPRKKPT